MTSELLSPKETAVIDTRTVVDLIAGSITITHDGGYGDLVGKTVAVDAETGFAFDTPLQPRPK